MGAGATLKIFFHAKISKRSGLKRQKSTVDLLTLSVSDRMSKNCKNVHNTTICIKRKPYIHLIFNYFYLFTLNILKRVIY